MDQKNLWESRREIYWAYVVMVRELKASGNYQDSPILEVAQRNLSMAEQSMVMLTKIKLLNQGHDMDKPDLQCNVVKAELLEPEFVESMQKLVDELKASDFAEYVGTRQLKLIDSQLAVLDVMLEAGVLK